MSIGGHLDIALVMIQYVGTSSALNQRVADGPHFFHSVIFRVSQTHVVRGGA